MITNQAKPITTYTNQAKINIGETWATIETTYAAETRTWGAMASIISNVLRAFGGSLWAFSTLPWQLPTPWIDSGGITNQAKP